MSTNGRTSDSLKEEHYFTNPMRNSVSHYLQFFIAMKYTKSATFSLLLCRSVSIAYSRISIISQ
jgi:hypothetical protein